MPEARYSNVEWPGMAPGTHTKRSEECSGRGDASNRLVTICGVLLCERLAPIAHQGAGLALPHLLLDEGRGMMGLDVDVLGSHPCATEHLSGAGDPYDNRVSTP